MGFVAGICNLTSIAVSHTHLFNFGQENQTQKETFIDYFQILSTLCLDGTQFPLV